MQLQEPELLPYTNGPAIRERRERLGLTPAALVERAAGAFDLNWLQAAERGAGVGRGQLATLARLLEVQPQDIELPSDERPPFRGLLAFEAEDAALFGGRGAATREVLAKLQAYRMVALIGASGSGKSSVVKSGVVPQLQLERGAAWCVLTVRPGADPLLALARALGSELDRDANEDSRIVNARNRAEILFQKKGLLSDYLSDIVERRAQSGKPARVLLFVDQWEELYTQTANEDRRRIFLEHLLEAFDGQDVPYRLLLTMRADFTGHLLDGYRPFFDAVQPGMQNLPRMSREELEEAIRKPAQAIGLRMDDGLVKAILDDAGEEPGVLALVEFTLTQLWEQRDKEGKRLTLESYNALGGLKGALDRHADEVYRRLGPEQQGAARRALMRLVHVSTLETYTRAQQPLSEMDEAERAILRSLADQDNRLVVISHDEGLKDDVVEVAHEALIREWHRLHDWVSSDPRFLKWREEVARRRRRYEDNGRRPEDLLQGYDLEEANSWLVTRGGAAQEDGDIPQPIRAFVTASNDRIEALASVQEEARQREIEQERRLRQEQGARAAASNRLARTYRIAAGVLVGLVAALVGVGWFLNDSLDRARAAETTAQSNLEAARLNEVHALSALAEASLADHRPVEAVKLGLAAWPRASGDWRVQIEESLRVVSRAVRDERLPARILHHDGYINGALTIPDGRLLSWSNDKSLREWDAKTGAQIGTAMRHDGVVRGALAMPDARLLSWSEDKTLRQWDAKTGAQIGPAMRHDDGVRGALLMPDGHLLSWSDDKTLRQWDTKTSAQIGPAMRHDGDVNGALVMPDGQLLSWSFDRTLRQWDAKTGEQIGPAMRHDDNVNGALVMPDGRLLSWSDDNTLRQWDAKTGEQIGPAMRHDGDVIGALVMPDGQLLSWSFDRTLRRWDAKTGMQIGPGMRHDAFVWGALVMPDGLLLSWSDDNTLRQWDAKTGEQIGPAMRHDDNVKGALVMPDGRLLSWSDDKTLRQWDAKTGAQIGPAMRHDGLVLGALVMPDGRLLSWSDNKTLRQWDAERRARRSAQPCIPMAPFGTR